MTTDTIRKDSPKGSANSRAERALRLFEERGDDIVELAAGVYRVPSCSGTGSYDVLYGEREECPCPDYQYGGGRPCKHLICIGIMHAARRSGVREVRIPRVVGGDPFKAAGTPRPDLRHESPHGCIDGWVYLGFEGEDENGEHVEEIERVPCRRCNADDNDEAEMPSEAFLPFHSPVPGVRPNNDDEL